MQIFLPQLVHAYVGGSRWSSALISCEFARRGQRHARWRHVLSAAPCTLFSCRGVGSLQTASSPAGVFQLSHPNINEVSSPDPEFLPARCRTAELMSFHLSVRSHLGLQLPDLDRLLAGLLLERGRLCLSSLSYFDEYRSLRGLRECRGDLSRLLSRSRDLSLPIPVCQKFLRHGRPSLQLYF